MVAPGRDAHDRYIQHYVDTGEARIIGIGRESVAQRKDGSPAHEINQPLTAISTFAQGCERMLAASKSKKSDL